MPTRDELNRLIQAHPRLTSVLAEVRARVDDDPGHDLGHLLRVAAWTLEIGGAEVDAEEAVAAALLHDLVNVPKDSPDRARASELCAEAARELLPRHGFDDPAAIDRISAAIRDHSFSRGATPEGPLAKALQDADRLEALGAIGVFRNISTAARMGSRYFHPTDPWAKERPLDDRRFAVDHYFVKLLTLPGTMQTAAGRAEAERRAAFMRGLLEQLGEELGEAPELTSGSG